MVLDESGDGSKYKILPFSTQGIYDYQVKKLKDKSLSPNYYNYDAQYYLLFLNDLISNGEISSANVGRDGWAIARNMGAGLAAGDLIASSVLGGRSWFGNGFNVGMLALSSVIQTDKEAFVMEARKSYRNFAGQSITFMKVDSIRSDEISDSESEAIFRERLAELRAIPRKAKLDCDDDVEHFQPGLYRASSLQKTECRIKGSVVAFKRRSSLSLPGSIMREALGPNIVSKVTFTNLGNEAMRDVMEAHSSLYEKGWIVIYPDFSGGVANKIVVSQGKVVKKFDPPKPI